MFDLYIKKKKQRVCRYFTFIWQCDHCVIYPGSKKNYARIRFFKRTIK